MKGGWQTKKLGDLFDITSSKRVFEADWMTEGVPFYRAREIVKLARHGFVDNELFISEEMFDRYSTKYGIPAAGDIMVTGVGTLGICYVVKKDDRFYFKDGNIIWLKKKTETDSRFVEYAFQSDYLRSQIDDSVGATVGTYTIIKAKSTLIPVPPLPEQQRIVAILNEAFEGIATAKANAEKNLQNARALFESHLQSVFTQRGEGWVEKPLEKVASIINGYAFKSTDFSPKGIVKCIKITNVGVREFVCVSDSYLPYGFDKKFDAVSVRKGSIVLALTRTIILGGLKVAVVPNEYNGALLNQRVAAIITIPDILTERFLFAYLSTEIVVDYVRGRVNTLMQPNLSISDLKSMLIPLPTIQEQDRIANHLDGLREETQRLESIYQQKLTALEALKKSLLHQAFSGEL